MMRALTLWPEWAWAICHLDKRVENRPERVARQLARHDGWLAIHAGKHIGGRQSEPAAQHGIKLMWYMAWGAGWEVRYPEVGDLGNRWRFISAGGRVVDLRRHDVATSAIVAVCRTGALLSDGADLLPHRAVKWQAPGSWAVELVDVQVLPKPVPCRGAQGLWTVPADVAIEVTRLVPTGGAP